MTEHTPAHLCQDPVSLDSELDVRRPAGSDFTLRRLVLVQVKNKAPAEVQITAEQLLREAKERELELLPPPPKQKITDQEELNDYKLRKRKVCVLSSLKRVVHSVTCSQAFVCLFVQGFEDNIRKNRTVISNWIKYAQWEESLKEIQRYCRSSLSLCVL